MSVRDGKDLVMCRGSCNLWSWLGTTPNPFHPAAGTGRGAGVQSLCRHTGGRALVPSVSIILQTLAWGALNVTFASQPSRDALGLGRIPKPVLSLSILFLLFFFLLPPLFDHSEGFEKLSCFPTE